MADDLKSAAERRWRRHLAAWKASGLSQAAYCRREGLVANDFSRWKRELARRDQRSAPTPAFVPVRVAQPLTAYGFEVALQGGRLLRFGGPIDLAALSAVVRVLEAAGLKPGDGPC
jgi:hypothetical protein